MSEVIMLFASSKQIEDRRRAFIEWGERILAEGAAAMATDTEAREQYTKAAHQLVDLGCRKGHPRYEEAMAQMAEFRRVLDELADLKLRKFQLIAEEFDREAHEIAKLEARSARFR